MEGDRDKLAHVELTENAIAVLKKRYLKKNEKGEAVEEPIHVFWRVAGNVAEGEEARRLYEEWGEKFLQIILSRKFMPNPPTLMRSPSIRRPWRRFAGQSARSAPVSVQVGGVSIGFAF